MKELAVDVEHLTELWDSPLAEGPEQAPMEKLQREAPKAWSAMSIDTRKEALAESIQLLVARLELHFET